MRGNQRVAVRPRSQANWSLAIDLLTSLRRGEPPLRAELAKKLHVGTGTMTDLVARLAGFGLLAESPAPASGRGRPSTLLGAAPEGPLVAVVDIGAERWRAGVSGLDGVPRLLSSGLVTPGRAEQTVTEIREATRGITGEYSDRLIAMAVAVAGTLEGNTVVQSSALFWDDVDLGGLSWGLPLVCGNDATLAGLAEVRRGAAVDAATAVHVLVMSGTGGGLCIDGVPAVGATGAGAEFGHLPFGDAGIVCDCGAAGCWDVGLGARALAREHGFVDGLRVDVERFRTWLGQVRGSEAPEFVARAVTSLARGTAGLVNALDPDVVTIGGLAIDLRAVDPACFDTAFRAGLMRHRRDRPPPVVDAAFGSDGPLTGAIELGLDAALTPAALDRWVAARA